MDRETSPQELIANLRRLAVREPADVEQLDPLVTECVALKLHISASPSLANSTPEIVWHFLSDADIRFKDHRCAKAQLTGLLSVLAQWERQSAA
ncbi:hypothetical protein [Dokdonella soli]|uniref:Uncharacterized protein n=1 Tax=Dokdonella soli TaxID=529810 RepID=A0ABP3TWL0_9GAMM